MNHLELKWATDEGGKKIITAEGVKTKIEINEDSKEIRNAKKFFREIIYITFLNNAKKEIVLVEDKDNELPEVKTIIEELIQVCNNDL